MELLVNPTSYTNAIDLIDLGVHQLCVGDNHYCVRNNCHLTLDEIKTLTQHKKNTKILVLVNRFYFDPELDNLTTYLMELSKLDIDGFIFGDFAINQICYEQKIRIPLIYNPETLVTNYDQFPFYLENNIGEVALARELNANEIKEIGQKKNQMKLQVQVSGYAYVMHSRWKLVSNFQETQHIDKELAKTKLLIREISRKEPMIIYEDEHGAHVFTNYSLMLFDKLSELNENHIDTIRIDSFLHDEQ
jgi:collagenase-like PrtC family protease